MSNFNLKLESIGRNPSVLCQISRGIEREALRIDGNGSLSKTSHSEKLGSALTNKYITTDYSESLLEFITPVSKKTSETISQLKDIHKFTYINLPEEYLWPMSMPCYVGNEDDIQIASYGTSNIAKMKSTYRLGLKHRYGSLMQIIAGVHYNFSFPDEFWKCIYNIDPKNFAHQKSEFYFALIRNYLRYGWVIPYFFGASPAICKSFIDNSSCKKYDFKTYNHSNCYLPWATSLRLSDLGYTDSNEQSLIKTSYNSLQEYISSITKAMNTKSSIYSNISYGNEEQPNQLNDNILQIENEHYAPIRPKRVTYPNEKPLEALDQRGVEYIEIRSLDVNPFSPVGISKEQVLFLDVFLTWLVLEDSHEISLEEEAKIKTNWSRVILEGRGNNLQLLHGSKEKTLKEWLMQIFEQLHKVAKLFDSNNSINLYQENLLFFKKQIEDPSLTLSGKFLDRLFKASNIKELGLSLARDHKAELEKEKFNNLDEKTFQLEVCESLMRQRKLESLSQEKFSTFLKNYFN